MSSRFAAATLLCALLGIVAEAHATETVLNDSILTSWQLLVPPGDPDIALSWPPTGNTYLEVHHRHTTDFYSVKLSVQGSPSAVYTPGVSGAVDSFTFAGDFRSAFEGAAPQSYSMISIAVRAAILQGGELFVAPTPIHVQIHGLSLPPDWVRRISGTLGAADFLRNRVEDMHPDFSAGGAPMTLALAVESGYQTSVPLTPEHLFEVDIDNVEMLAIPAEASGSPSLRFGSDNGIVDQGGIPTAIYVDEEDEGPQEGRRLALPVRLSAASSEDVHFQILRAEPPPPGHPQSGRVRAGNTAATVLVPADRSAEVYRLEALAGVTTGVPSQALFLTSDIGERPEHECVMDFIDLLFQVLARAPSFPAPAGPTVLPATLQAGEESELLSTLRRFRDQVMVASPAGRYYSALYTTYSPDLRRAILRRPTVIFDLRSSHGAWLDALAALVAGPGDATPVTPDMATDLNRILDTLASGASPALARAISAERARLELQSIAGTSIGALWQRVVDRVEPEPCAAGGEALCLAGGRYRVEADWRTPAGATGRAHAVALTGDSGYFWFFDSANVEILTKVVDGCGLNQRIWSYSAGLTNLEVDLFVFDSATGRGRTYRNPQATSFAPILDSSFLECVAEPAAAATERPSLLPLPTVQPSGGAGCTPGPETLCLDGGRFRVEAEYRTAAGASGAARAVPLTDDTGTFWFFNAANIELVVKTIDACGLPGFDNYWVFAGGTTDVEVTLRVTDTLRDVTKSYHRPLGVPFAPILDSAAFATCP